MRNSPFEFLIHLLSSDLLCGMTNTAPSQKFAVETDRDAHCSIEHHTPGQKILLLYSVISFLKTFFIAKNPPLGTKMTVNLA
jgi:hypothetical protein